MADQNVADRIARLAEAVTCLHCTRPLTLGDHGSDDQQMLCSLRCPNCTRRYTLHVRLIPLPHGKAA